MEDMARVGMVVGGRSVERSTLVSAAVQIVDEKVHTSFELATLRARRASERGAIPREAAWNIVNTANDWIDFVARGEVGMEEMFDVENQMNKRDRGGDRVKVVGATRRVRWR